MGTGNRSAIGTLVDRASRFTILDPPYAVAWSPDGFSCWLLSRTVPVVQDVLRVGGEPGERSSGRGSDDHISWPTQRAMPVTWPATLLVATA